MIKINQRHCNFTRNVMLKIPHNPLALFSRRKLKNGKYIAVPVRAPLELNCNNRWSNLESNVLSPRRFGVI
jgi:hypothetical protein